MYHHWVCTLFDQSLSYIFRFPSKNSEERIRNNSNEQKNKSVLIPAQSHKWIY